ncbi:HlyD family type I secretion periplasmic adaptor subunit [Endozoicomonas sp. GU-1]|uniref:HlyD family type I secretion periplasmic adaptor subunit n=1 Tax=Endozoicomonas sp. GU-1 TaxID=3009078 RepID=UPI0022B5C856|nr:HlyD family type I secretion periplasmic adaptor subunit [Endozoicomonas sp. GU-1]WBA82169.1 HlyD family type I secretion periplasmic adaptor subunit [Endozoicomonas sp. GU-1]WBA85110.1 HlyD family type I secretion periplasmic adaptor subunit [Endozoicomonas sp. GU-1]
MKSLFSKATKALLSRTERPESLDYTRRQFLPAALEVEDTPASPASRVIVKVIIALFVIAILWACFGKIDIVATAQGKIIPGERVKTIQPMVIGEVQVIHVREGDEVKAGDPLITLVGTVTEAESVRLQQEIEALGLQLARQQAFVAYLDAPSSNLVPTVLGPLGSPVGMHTHSYRKYAVTEEQAPGQEHEIQRNSESQTFVEQLLFQQIEDYRTSANALISQEKSKRAELQTIVAQVNKLKRVLPIIEERTQSLKALYDKSYGSRVEYLELEQQRIELEEDIKAQSAAVKQLAAEAEALQHQLASLHAQTRRESLDQQEQLHRQLDTLEQERIKAEELHDQQQITSPIDGTVQQLQVHTIGGVVQPAQALMQIVPAEAKMEVEAWILNKDIGFVHEGQSAEVKIDTFNFTKYGLIDGMLTNVSNDAVPDEQLGLRYLANVQIEKDWMQVESRKVNLAPGMSVAVEIKTGQRRLIEYFLSPLLRFKQESIRER